MALNFPNSPVDGQTYNGYIYEAASTSWRSANPFADTLPAGTIVQWGGTSAPGNWLLCDGSAVSRTTYAALYAVIGIIYGAGDGSTTFNLPDLRGRVPVGKNSGTFSVLGGAGGAETHTLTIAEMPAHTHGQARGNDNNLGGGAGQYGWQSTDDKSGDYATYSTGGGGAHNNLQPYQVVNYIIKTTYGTTPGMSQAEVNLSGYDARLTTVETANATTNKSGLVPVIPSSVVVGSGSASIAASGLVTFTGVSSLSLNNVFSASSQDYYLNFSFTMSAAGDARFQYRTAGTNYASAYYTTGRYTTYLGGVGNYGNQSNGSFSYFGANNTMQTQVTAEVHPRDSYSSATWRAWSIAQAEYINGGFNVLTSTFPDGLTISTTTGTMTGNIQILKFRN